MTGEEAMIATILAHPEDDLPRLVYADWLDETAGSVPCDLCSGSGKDKVQDVVSDGKRYTYVGPVGPCPKCKGDCSLPDGRHERAEFIRAQCELAKLEHVTKPAIGGPILSDEFDIAAEVFREWEAKKRLRKRERELWSTVWLHVASGLPGTRLHGSDLGTPTVIHALAEEWQYPVRRGFVDGVTLPLASFMGGTCEACDGRGLPLRMIHPPPRRGDWPDCPTCSGTGRTEGIAKRLFESQPVTRVEFTDREPYCGHGADENGEFWWIISPILQYGNRVFDRSTTHEKLWDGVSSGEPGRRVANTYKTRDLAITALSDAAVAYGRELAGLPQLKGEA